MTVHEVTVAFTGEQKPGSPGEICVHLLKRVHNHLDRLDLDPLVEAAARQWADTLPYDLPRTTYLQDEAARLVLDSLAHAVVHEVARTLDRGLAVDMAVALSMFLTPENPKKES